MARIKDLDMTAADCLVVLGEGNPGALTAMMEMFKHSPAIDPQALLGGMAPIFSLDQYGIYGPRIWMLYKYVCGHDVGKTLALLRGVQLGMIYQHQLDEAIDTENAGAVIDVDLMVHEVCARLSQFNHEARAQ